MCVQKKTVLSLSLLLFGGLCLAGPIQAVTVEAVPLLRTVGVGESVQIDLMVSGLGELASPSLGAFDLTVCFDPELLDFTDIEFGPHLGDTAAGEALTGWVDVDGLVGFEVSLLLPSELIARQPESFTLFTLTLDGAAVGSSPLDVIANAPLSDETGNPLATETVSSAIAIGIPAMVDIPTLSQWGALLLASLLMVFGLRHLRARPA